MHGFLPGTRSALCWVLVSTSLPARRVSVHRDFVVLNSASEALTNG
jgi:hypothetical protein